MKPWMSKSHRLLFLAFTSFEPHPSDPEAKHAEHKFQDGY
jgi:hypothetical protein